MLGIDVLNNRHRDEYGHSEKAENRYDGPTAHALCCDKKEWLMTNSAGSKLTSLSFAYDECMHSIQMHKTS